MKKKTEVPIQMDEQMLKAQYKDVEKKVDQIIEKSLLPEMYILEIFKNKMKILEDKIYNIEFGNFFEDIDVDKPIIIMDIDLEGGKKDENI